ncbi:MAG TPA: 50S ribosomal protein L23 [Bacteroidales bacterium]|jgi:large subunit ribosomal protein L23|nr:50S ribosomal protein L23 [Bacteroidales bacterium]
MDILVKPIVTEKMTMQGENFNRYGFVVDTKANKLQIKKAIEDMYGVSVESVNTMRYLGKKKSRYTKSGVIAGRSKSFKKAIVTLADGEKIDFYSNI